MMRIRINFSKTEIIKYTSHLDLYRAWERTLRRAELPLAYSKGFKPHPHINLACALPLGFTSENDLVDIWLEQDICLEEISRRLIKAVPPGIEIKSVIEIPIQTSSLQKQLKAFEYCVTLFEKVSDLPEKLAALMASESLWRERNDKKYDLRPLLIELTSPDIKSFSQQQILMILKAGENTTGRPEEVLRCLSIEPASTQIHRRRLILEEST